MIKIRSGIGYDIHRLESGSGLLLGGIVVSQSLKAVAHSDGDVLIHSLIDSLLGSMGEADIGETFPDSDPRYRGISSAILLDQVKQMVAQRNFEIINIDCVVITESPKISPFKEEIKNNVSRILGIPAEEFNLKAKTKEKVDSVGRGEAIECFTIAMIRSRE